MTDNFSYQLNRCGAVVIDDGLTQPIILNRENIVDAIEYTKNHRSEYATQEAWELQLAKHQGALEFIDSHRLVAYK